MTANRKNQFLQVGLAVAYYRRLRHLTQNQLASRVSLSRTHISNLEAPGCVYSISLNTLFDIADALDVPAMYLLDFGRFPPASGKEQILL